MMQVSSVTSDGFTELRAFLGRLAPPEPLEAMYKEARGKATEVRTWVGRRGTVIVRLGQLEPRGFVVGGVVVVVAAAAVVPCFGSGLFCFPGLPVR